MYIPLAIKIKTGNKMKHIITLIFLFLLVACGDRPKGLCKRSGAKNSTFYDKRCLKLRDEAYKKGVETGVCYKPPENSEKLIFQKDVERLDPDHEACNALDAEARKKCDELPPDPDSIVQTSGSATYRGGKPVMINGQPVCP